MRSSLHVLNLELHWLAVTNWPSVGSCNDYQGILLGKNSWNCIIRGNGPHPKKTCKIYIIMYIYNYLIGAKKALFLLWLLVQKGIHIANCKDIFSGVTHTHTKKNKTYRPYSQSISLLSVEDSVLTPASHAKNWKRHRLLQVAHTHTHTW